MALKRRDSLAIGEVGNYMQEASNELRISKATILKDVDNMLNNYKGIDANVIRTKFVEAINKMDSLIERFDYYSMYMQSVSRHDRENIQNANKQINSLLNTPLNNNIEENTDQTMNISTLNGGEEHVI